MREEKWQGRRVVTLPLEFGGQGVVAQATAAIHPRGSGS
jgi:hypothetical protein